MAKLSPLRPGDLIALAAPAKSISEERVREHADYLQAKGYRTVFDEQASDSYLAKLAGTDEQRIDAMNQWFRSPDARAILCLTGGYGASRILSRLDWGALAARPKMICGFSDITALHMAAYAETGLPSLHSPNLDSRSRTKYTDDIWRDHLTGNVKPGDGIILPPDLDEDDKPQTWRDGVGEGVLIGGNLSLAAALEGTPHAVPKDRDVILFLEDVGEHGYRVDIMLHQLREAGSFDRVKGALLGKFTPRGNSKKEKPDVLRNVLKAFFDELSIPVIANLPFGHVRDNHAIIHGARARMDAGQKTMAYLEDVFRRG